MAKVFTITEGLETMGALKTGGQGSVYKAKRIGEIITAVKLLPTPIYNESKEDKSYKDFKNEVEKLKRVNEKPNPHVVSILSYGITDSGSLPFIEMEFIEGPDVEELLKPPNDPIFSVKEVVKFAEQLASALAHCHLVDLKHGDIKSNNVKYNTRTGNYMLLDFGLSILTDEVRRTSLRRAGALEFMAPEQSDGLLLIQSDVYGFGIIIFELLSGIVPFPLIANTETARNQVILAQREESPPDILSLRKKHAPTNWGEDRTVQEMSVPAWLTDMVYKCLEKAPEKRFPNGVKLLEYIYSNSVSTATNTSRDEKFALLDLENRRLLQENKDLRNLLKEHNTTTTFKQNQTTPAHGDPINKNKGTLQKKALIFFALALALVLFLLFLSKGDGNDALALSSSQPVQPKGIIGQYRVLVSRAYFYSEANEEAKESAYLIPSNDVISALDEKNGFVYTEFASNTNKSVRGWLRKQDLMVLDELVGFNKKMANVRPNASDIEAQLQEARQSIANGQIKRALYIYNFLAKQNVPEAMYVSGNLALQNQNEEIDCKEGYELVYQANQKGYTQAKSVIGFLYAFGEDYNTLQLKNYNYCTYKENITKGAQLLMEATLEGDTDAKRWLQQLNRRQNIQKR